MALKTKKKCLADKINTLITSTPATFGSDDEVDDTAAKVVEHYDENADSNDELQSSKFRRQNVETLDQTDNRYAGKKVSRKDIHNDTNADQSDDSLDTDDSEDQEIAAEDEESEDEEDNKESAGEDNSEESEFHDEDESAGSAASDQKQFDNSVDQYESSDGEVEEDEEDDDDEYKVDIDNPLYRNRDETSQFKTISDTNIKADIEKGICVRNQLKLWENLLEMRIKLQKCVITSNQMPQHNVHKDYRNDADFMKKTNETRDKLTVLLNNFLDLQNTLFEQYPETKNLNTQNKKRKASDTVNESNESNDSMDEEIPSDTEDENETKGETGSNEDDREEEGELEETQKSKLEAPRKKMKLSDYEKILQENHEKYTSYRDSVIQKWNEKTRIATGKLNKGMTQTTLKQIEFALSDKAKLRKRTQLKRSEYTIVGKPEAIEDKDGRRVQEYDPEIFDDDDFYHQLLRDLIEYKSSDITDPIQLSKQWIRLQNMRSKMKRKIDTRATKGRRVRYNVHNKLVNFMAPITVGDTWTDYAKNELYNSLFGKIKAVEEVAR